MWKGIEGDEREEKRLMVKRLTRQAAGKWTRIARIEEREGEKGRMIVIVEIESEEDKDKMMRMGAELWRKWRVKVDEDFILKERRIRWRISGESEEGEKGREAGSGVK